MDEIVLTPDFKLKAKQFFLPKMLNTENYEKFKKNSKNKPKTFKIEILEKFRKILKNLEKSYPISHH